MHPEARAGCQGRFGRKEPFARRSICVCETMPRRRTAQGCKPPDQVVRSQGPSRIPLTNGNLLSHKPRSVWKTVVFACPESPDGRCPARSRRNGLISCSPLVQGESVPRFILESGASHFIHDVTARAALASAVGVMGAGSHLWMATGAQRGLCAARAGRSVRTYGAKNAARQSGVNRRYIRFCTTESTIMHDWTD